MEEKDADLIERLAREDEEFRRLLEQHRNLDREIKEYEKRPYLTPSQALEKARLKKLKLASKDKMEAILRKHRTSCLMKGVKP